MSRGCAARVLVTGAAGFIGSHTCMALIRRGCSVTGLDLLTDCYDPGRKRANLREVEIEAGRLDLVQEDVRDPAALERLFSTRGFDAVVHLAAMTGVRASASAPHLYCDVNITGTLTLLESCRRHGTNTFILASTSSVYGDGRRTPFEESDACDRPLSPYAATKRAAEMLGQAWSRRYGLHFTALRLFTVYGPRGRPDMMAHRILDSIYRGEAIPLYGAGCMRRDWTYVGDVVDGIVAAVERALPCEVINLGRGEPVLLLDFVRLAEQLAGREARLVPCPVERLDALQTCADTRRARQLLGVLPRTDLRTGVGRFHAWYRAAVLGR